MTVGGGPVPPLQLPHARAQRPATTGSRRGQQLSAAASDGSALGGANDLTRLGTCRPISTSPRRGNQLPSGPRLLSAYPSGPNLGGLPTAPRLPPDRHQAGATLAPGSGDAGAGGRHDPGGSPRSVIRRGRGLKLVPNQPVTDCRHPGPCPPRRRALDVPEGQLPVRPQIGPSTRSSRPPEGRCRCLRPRAREVPANVLHYRHRDDDGRRRRRLPRSLSIANPVCPGGRVAARAGGRGLPVKYLLACLINLEGQIPRPAPPGPTGRPTFRHDVACDRPSSTSRSVSAEYDHIKMGLTNPGVPRRAARAPAGVAAPLGRWAAGPRRPPHEGQAPDPVRPGAGRGPGPSGISPGAKARAESVYARWMAGAAVSGLHGRRCSGRAARHDPTGFPVLIHWELHVDRRGQTFQTLMEGPRQRVARHPAWQSGSVSGDHARRPGPHPRSSSMAGRRSRSSRNWPHSGWGQPAPGFGGPRCGCWYPRAAPAPTPPTTDSPPDPRSRTTPSDQPARPLIPDGARKDLSPRQSRVRDRRLLALEQARR